MVISFLKEYTCCGFSQGQCSLEICVALSCPCVVDRDAVVFVDMLDASSTRGDRRGQCEHNNLRKT